MKKNYLVFAVAVVAMMLASCAKKEIVNPVTDATGEYQGTTKAMTFAVTTEGEESKTSINLENGAVSWSEGDKAKFAWGFPFAEGPQSGVVESEEIDLANKAFTVALPEGFTENNNTHLYGVYPSSVEVSYLTNGGALYVTVPTEQDGTFASASIAVAKGNKADLTETLAFYNLCGLLQIKVNDAAAKKIVISGNETIAGKVSLTWNKTTGMPEVKAYSTEEKQISLNVNGAGTYYAAVLPASITDLYVAIYDDSDNLIGDKAAESTLVVARKQIKKLGTIATGFEGRYYVKVDGEGDGSSWDNAANYTELRKKLLANNTALNVFMAAGTYTATEASMGSSNTSCVNVIKGGYPADATGYSLRGRDCVANETILDAGGNNRIWILQVGSWDISGLTFANAKRTKDDTGSALVVEAKSGSTFKIASCKFTGNTNEGNAGGGAVRVSGGVVNMSNCVFTGNTAANNGGAIYVNSTGTLKAEKCLLTSNVAKAAMGAVYVTGKLEARDCSFIDNNQTSVALASNGVAYIDNCYFTYTSDPAKPNAIISPAATTTKVRINNSVLTGNWGTNGQYQIYGAGDVLVVNTTMLGQIGNGNIGVGASGKLNVINSIVANAASSGAGKSFAVNASATAGCNYSLYSTFSGTVTATSSLAGVKYYIDTNKNFPVGYTWYKTNAATMFANNQSSTLAVSDCRGNLHFYEWDGNVPVIDENTFTKATLAQIQTLVSTADADFAAWLGDALSKDIRGEERNAVAVWPGSYEDPSSAVFSSLENLNVK